MIQDTAYDYDYDYETNCLTGSAFASNLHFELEISLHFASIVNILAVLALCVRGFHFA